MKRNDKYNLTWAMGTIAGLALSVPLMMVAPAFSAADITRHRCELQEGQLAGQASGFPARSGTLRRSAPLPVGRSRLQPQGKSVNITYMVPLKDIDAHRISRRWAGSLRE